MTLSTAAFTLQAEWSSLTTAKEKTKFRMQKIMIIEMKRRKHVGYVSVCEESVYMKMFLQI